MPIFGQKMSILLKLHIKNPPFSKNIQLSCPYFVKNMSILHKHIALMSFFWNFLWKPLLSRPQFVKKTSILSRLHYILWAQKVNWMPVFPISRKKKCSHAHVLSKNVHSLKTNCSRAHVLSCKRLFFPKHCALMSIFFIFCMKNSCYHAHIWSKKTSILPKLDYILGQKSQRDAFFFDFSRKINCSHALILPKITSIL